MQYDNARDFVTVGGMDTIVRPAMEAEQEQVEKEEEEDASLTELRSRAALVFCSCVQSHAQVKERVTSAGWTEFILQRMKKERSKLVRSIGILQYVHTCLMSHTRFITTSD